MGKVFNLSKEDARTIHLLDKGIIQMRSLNDAKFDSAINKQNSLRKDYIRSIVKEAI